MRAIKAGGPWLSRSRQSAGVVPQGCASKGETRLHLGCGANIMEGWLNADLVQTDSIPPQALKLVDSIFIMDATQRFPFTDASFEYIYCEDFVEHFSQRDGLSMFTECYRVLRPGGVWRFSTPCFDRILPGLKLAAGRDAVEFGHWGWGHKLLYTEAYARTVLEAIGFDAIKTCQFGESGHAVLVGIDTRVEQTYLNLILEASKPTLKALT